MIASLPMYDFAGTRTANDSLWQAIRENYGHGPLSLDRSGDPHVHWQRRDLVLSQTCGWPYRKILHGKVRLVGTPDYGVPGCPPGYYRSFIVVRRDDKRSELDDFRDARLARNDHRSQSGWAAVEECIRVDRLSDIIETGSHVNAMRLVAKGGADFAAIDAVTWALLERDTDETRALRILTATSPTPGLPFITSLHEHAGRMFSAIEHAIWKMQGADRERLMLRGLVAIPAHDYLAMP
ncbi:MAG: PhnD/SsuA/transferrin family substrate-binding protein [Roseobacter sp.]|jgi:ABC-type phosphate/phosphonate transport system substrate-binding protein